MLIEIDVNSDIPIYTQLAFQIKQGVFQKKIKPGDSLPSVRSLAGDIGINLHTVNKAYKALVEEGVVVQVKKGYQISLDQPAKIGSNYQKVVEQRIEELLIDEGIFNFDLERLLKSTREKLKEGDNHD